MARVKVKVERRGGKKLARLLRGGRQGRRERRQGRVLLDGQV